MLRSPVQQMGVGSELGRNRFWMGLCIIHTDLMRLTRERRATSPEAELRIQSHYVMKALMRETGSAEGWQRETGRESPAIWCTLEPREQSDTFTGLGNAGHLLH